jgi:glycosyltransferase involved in cell wall biosynthesis
MKKKVLLLVNHEIVIYNFRKELIEALIEKGYEVIISCPYGVSIEKLIQLGAFHKNIKIDRRGINPINDFILFLNYKKLVRKYNPDVILTYTVKPNIYGGLVSRITKTPILVNITGLGSALEKKGLINLITTMLYKYALKNANMVFFQNNENLKFMIDKGIKGREYKLIPGSGVNVEYFEYLEYPINPTINFFYVGRVMKEKGIDYYLQAAKVIKSKYKNIVFHVLGACEEKYKSILDEYKINGYIIYHGKVDDVRQYYKYAHAIIHPSFHEGMSNVLLEAASSGRPIIASNIAGCREIIDEGLNGFTFESKNQESLNKIVEKFIKLSDQEKKQMGINGREKMIKDFNRKRIVDIYIENINKIMEVI